MGQFTESGGSISLNRAGVSFLHLALLLRSQTGVLAHHDSRNKAYSFRGEPPEGMDIFSKTFLSKAGELGILDPARLMSDTTAQEAMIPYPNEVGLMKRFTDLTVGALKKVGGKFSNIKTKAKEIADKVKGLVIRHGRKTKQLHGALTKDHHVISKSRKKMLMKISSKLF